MKKFNKLLVFICAFSVIYIGILLLLANKIIGSSARKISDIEKYGQSVEELEIPDDIKVVGIGEATHGSCEFQTIKLTMLQNMIKKGKCHSIAFEMSPGEAAEINDAIHCDDVDLEELMSRTEYPLYDTEQIIELIEWMRDYNKDKSLDESVMFYGVDCQGLWRDISYLVLFGEKHPDLFSEEELEHLKAMNDAEEYDIDSEKDFFTGIYDKLLTYNEYEYKYAALVTKILLQSYDAPDYEEAPDKYASYRDENMAQNLMSFYNMEGERGYSQILITAHNGHTMKGSQEGYGEVSAMGEYINEVFEGSYFSIGTEYYNAGINIHVAGTFGEDYLRKDYNFCSDDILAYQAKYFEDNQYCLDFSKVTDDGSEVYERIHTPGFMGLVGEGYNSLAEQRRADRVRLVQADRYDAVIYFFTVKPIKCLNY